MKFLLQTINNKLVHDFTFELTRCEEYHKWIGNPISLRRQESIDFETIKNPDHYVPVGSVEFVSAYLNKFYPDAKKALEPINVPEVLFPFAGRTIVNVTKPEDMNPFGELVFAKSLTKIKHPENGFFGLPDFERCNGFQISTPIDFVSEWRVFVFNGVIMGCRNYLGDFFAFPDVTTIKNMVSAYTDAPKTYTLDVGVTTNGETVVIECHRFFSCGLYGFSWPSFYPAMLSQEWFEMKNMR